ncbi:calcium-transporting atpase 2 [Acrodontium crateriforme]|uniref:Calcium-transporting ATPase n=1 Tax=Acrodontium crateriforme TaxID=150365 RepID=A0AAQ3M3H7_9PEZI|nr:calcium-transporting atpase 2 [Acrodontium crateriforme]
MADEHPTTALPTGTSTPSGPGRRPRAPTITIDTSAVQKSAEHDSNSMPTNPEHELDELSDDGKSINGDKSPRLKPQDSAPSELRRSFDSRDSRPTSPHNVSSPTLWSNQQNFLAVPSQRARGLSFDSVATGESNSTSEFTYVNTHSDGHHKSFNADDKRSGAGDQCIIPDGEALEPDPGTEDEFVRQNNPFAFTPGQLGKLLNPKSLGAFHAVGGLNGMERGLRSDRNTGLSIDEDRLEGTVSFEEATSSPSSDVTQVEVPASAANGDKAPPGSFTDRKRIFGDNILPEKKPKSFLQLAWMAYNDKVIIVLTVAAVIALALGLYQALGTPEGGVEWVEGVAICVAIAAVVLVGAVNDWQKERQFAKLNKKKESRNVQVCRNGRTQEINVHDIVVGDVLLIESGDILPVDGIFITGHGVKCDESSATGESDIMKKSPADDVYRAMEAGENLRKMDPFMISGAKITEGFGRMMVTAVGTKSTHGRTMLSLQDDNDATPLQSKLNDLAEYIAKLGSAAALLLFIVLLIKFLAQLPKNHDTAPEKAQQFLTILITAVTIVVVAVPEGLPLAVTLALAYATKRMLKDRNLVRVLRSCETMGNATTVCSDKTGTLTQNVMTVVAGTLGTSNRFHSRPDDDQNELFNPSTNDHENLDGVAVNEFISALAKPVKLLWKDSIAINSTAFESEEDGKKVFVGSKTETALLDFATSYLAMDSVSIERDNAEIVQTLPFDSSRKCMAMVVKLKSKPGYRLIVKGASEIMLKYCTKLISDPTRDVDSSPLTTYNRKTLGSLIDAYASRSLRTIGFIFRDFDTESWPPRGVRRSEDDKTQAVFADICKEMTFLGLVGIQDPLRPGVTEAVKDCMKAGVFVRMVTGDNIVTAKAIATECGIFTSGMALEGPEFRKMNAAEQRAVIPKLQVLARSSPDDKRILVKRLKEMGETVAVTGDGTNDAPALKLSDVGFSMNIAGTEVAKEASDIILMDDNFASIVMALMWGRAVNDAVRKFLQFQITVNITAVLLAFISAVANDQEQSVLSAVQLLWVNLIMDTMAALALATDPPSRKILDRKPDPKSAPLISVTMWKMIIGQAIYQLVVTLILNFGGWHILNYDNRTEGLTAEEQLNLDNYRQNQVQTLVFNTFVWMQIFNALNNRRLDNRFNVFEGITKNWFFIGIFLCMIAGQVIIIFVGGWDVFQAEHQTGAHWAFALVLGAISIPIGVVVRLVPDELAVKVIPRAVREWAERRRKAENVIVTDEENAMAGHHFEVSQALDEIRQELAWIKKYKGGRLNNLRFAVRHPKDAFFPSRSPSRHRHSGSLPRTPNNEMSDEGSSMAASPAPSAYGHAYSNSLTSDGRSQRRRGRSRSNSALAGAAMAGIIAGSVAGGFSPIERRPGEADSLKFPSSTRERSKSDLSQEVHNENTPQPTSSNTLVPPGPTTGGLAPPPIIREPKPPGGRGPLGDDMK